MRYEREIVGVLGCFDRLVITGTLNEIAHPEAMDAYLYREGFRAFDIGLFAKPLRQRIRDNAVEVAREAGIEIEYLSRSKGVRKEDLVAKVLARRGSHPGLVHVISVVKSCTTFKPWRNPKTGLPGLKMQTGKCSTCYFYLIDPDLGLMHVRVPTWLPCRLQIYFNVHHWLAAQLRRQGIDFKMDDSGDGTQEYKMAPLKKSIYSLSDVVELLGAATGRYLDFIGTLEDDTPQSRDLTRISRPVRDLKDRSWRGFNRFLKEDPQVLLAITRGEFFIHRLSNRRLRAFLADKTTGLTARILRRLRNHGLIKEIAHTYRYYESQKLRHCGVVGKLWRFSTFGGCCGWSWTQQCSDEVHAFA